jgi:hypothetical protein
MAWIGDFALESTFDTKFTTVTTTGAPTTLAGTPVVSAYVGNSTTQLTAGITLTVDFDAVTGLHNVRVVATAANGYATASNYQLVITTGTVGGTSVVGYVVAEFSLEARSALRPTTAARTLDVSAGGEAGVDWANVGSPTTAQNLSATNIDVDQIVASVSGAVGSVTGAVGSVTGAVGSIGAGGIAAASFAAGAIDAAAIAANAIGASELAADAVAEIADAIWDEDATGHQTLGTYGQAIGDPVADTATIYAAVVTNAAGVDVAADIIAVKADTAAILVDTGTTLDGRLPAALVSGRIDASVGAMAAGTVTAAAIADNAIDAASIAADAITAAKIADGAIDAATFAAGAITATVIADGAIDAATFAAGAIDAAAIAANAIGASELAADAVAEIADGVWDELIAGHTTAVSFGDKFGAHLPAILKGIVAAAGSTTTAVVLNATTGIDGGVPSATNDFYKGRVIIFTSGALAGQATDVTSYTGATQTLTVTALTAAPAAAVTLVVV